MREEDRGARRLQHRPVGRGFVHQRQGPVSKVNISNFEFFVCGVCKLRLLLFFKFRSISCQTDYLQISDTTGTHKLCGGETKIFKDEFCANTIYLTYVLKSPASFLYKYRGFRVYYESNIHFIQLDVSK